MEPVLLIQSDDSTRRFAVFYTSQIPLCVRTEWRSIPARHNFCLYILRMVEWVDENGLRRLFDKHPLFRKEPVLLEQNDG